MAFLLAGVYVCTVQALHTCRVDEVGPWGRESSRIVGCGVLIDVVQSTILVQYGVHTVTQVLHSVHTQDIEELSV